MHTPSTHPVCLVVSPVFGSQTCPSVLAKTTWWKCLEMGTAWNSLTSLLKCCIHSWLLMWDCCGLRIYILTILDHSHLFLLKLVGNVKTCLCLLILIYHLDFFKNMINQSDFTNGTRSLINACYLINGVPIWIGHVDCCDLPVGQFISLWKISSKVRCFHLKKSQNLETASSIKEYMSLWCPSNFFHHHLRMGPPIISSIFPVTPGHWGQNKATGTTQPWTPKPERKQIVETENQSWKHHIIHSCFGNTLYNSIEFHRFHEDFYNLHSDMSISFLLPTLPVVWGHVKTKTAPAPREKHVCQLSFSPLLSFGDKWPKICKLFGLNQWQFPENLGVLKKCLVNANSHLKMISSQAIAPAHHPRKRPKNHLPKYIQENWAGRKCNTTETESTRK